MNDYVFNDVNANEKIPFYLPFNSLEIVMGKTSTSKLRWFVRGMAGGFILYAALNALSWFFRSTGWSDLCGATINEHTEAIGFPFEIWREGAGHQGLVLAALGIHLLIGLVVSIVAGFVAVALSQRIESMLPEESTDKTVFKMTFSVRGLLIVTSLIAVTLGLVQSLGASPWLLGTIYFAGPLMLILIAMGPVGIPWEQRSVILVLTAACMLVGAVIIGVRMGMEFDRVLLGIFICWVPQSAFAAVLIGGLAVWRSGRASKVLD